MYQRWMHSLNELCQRVRRYFFNLTRSFSIRKFSDVRIYDNCNVICALKPILTFIYCDINPEHVEGRLFLFLMTLKNTGSSWFTLSFAASADTSLLKFLVFRTSCLPKVLLSFLYFIFLSFCFFSISFFS